MKDSNPAFILFFIVAILFCVFMGGKGCAPTLKVDKDAFIVAKEKCDNYTSYYTIRFISGLSFPDGIKDVKMVLPNSFGDVSYRVVYTNDTIRAFPD